LFEKAAQSGAFAGLDVGGKRTAMCVLDEAGKIVFQGMVDTLPQMLAAALMRFEGKLAKVGLESGPFTPHFFRSRFLSRCEQAFAAALTDTVR
jgi:hypothetical protein